MIKPILVIKHPDASLITESLKVESDSIKLLKEQYHILIFYSQDESIRVVVQDESFPFTNRRD